MTKFLNINLYAEISDDIPFTEAQAAAILSEFEDRLRQLDLDIDDSEYQLLDY